MSDLVILPSSILEPPFFWSTTRSYRRYTVRIVSAQAFASLMFTFPDAIEGAVYDDQQGGWKYPSNAKIPDVSFAVGDKLYTLNAKDFGFGPADEGFTLGGIQSRGDMTFDIFGDVFLKSVYVVCESLSLSYIQLNTER